MQKEEARIPLNEPHYLWNKFTILNRLSQDDSVYIVPDILAPQEYGINIIPLYFTEMEDKVIVNFMGHSEVNETAGWRYGFVTSQQNGAAAQYELAYSAEENTISYQMKDGDEQLYLVVIGVPADHTSYPWEPGWPRIKRYPYELQIKNVMPEGCRESSRADIRERYAGQNHPNGGGFVANSASVSSSVYVGPNTVVLGNSRISKNAQVKDNARVENAIIGDDVIISGNARLFEGNYSGDAQVKDFAIPYFCTVKDNAVLKGKMFSWGNTFSGEVVGGGDAEIGGCCTGVYLQFPHPNKGRTSCDGEGENHFSNQDINEVFVPFYGREITSIIESSVKKERLTNYYNPLNNSTTIEFTLTKTENISLNVFDTMGREVTKLIDEKSYSRGVHEV